MLTLQVLRLTQRPLHRHGGPIYGGHISHRLRCRYFGIPGIGKATYEAIVTGDQPVLKAVVSLTAILFVLVVVLTDILYRAVDPRVTLE